MHYVPFLLIKFPGCTDTVEFVEAARIFPNNKRTSGETAGGTEKGIAMYILACYSYEGNLQLGER